MLLLLHVGCGTPGALPSLTIPGFGGPGANRPPVFVAYALLQNSLRQLQLQANAIDLDGNGLVITYEQVSGPVAVERSSFRVGGAMNILLDIPSDGTYAFRIIASDGFFYSDVRVTRTVTTPPPPPIDPSTNPGTGTPDNLVVGRFDVTITGQVIDASGSESFAQPATIEIAPRPAVYSGTNALVVTMATDALPTMNTRATGALQFQTAATRAGIPTDIVTVRQLINEISILGDGHGLAIASGAAGVFRPTARTTFAVEIGFVSARLVVNADTISGTVEFTDAGGTILYTAQLSGIRL
ncbi:MAG: hypothetical protein L6Q92_02445 [Phycisphaerae bacterium]|nr:hypothetical protein [Phycisphaerae bacterium]